MFSFRTSFQRLLPLISITFFASAPHSTNAQQSTPTAENVPFTLIAEVSEHVQVLRQDETLKEDDYWHFAEQFSFINTMVSAPYIGNNDPTFSLGAKLLSDSGEAVYIAINTSAEPKDITFDNRTLSLASNEIAIAVENFTIDFDIIDFKGSIVIDGNDASVYFPRDLALPIPPSHEPENSDSNKGEHYIFKNSHLEILGSRATIYGAIEITGTPKDDIFELDHSISSIDGLLIDAGHGEDSITILSEQLSETNTQQNTWTINNLNAGQLSTATDNESGLLHFSSLENISAPQSSNQFTFEPTGSISGTITANNTDSFEINSPNSIATLDGTTTVELPSNNDTTVEAIFSNNIDFDSINNAENSTLTIIETDTNNIIVGSVNISDFENSDQNTDINNSDTTEEQQPSLTAPSNPAEVEPVSFEPDTNDTAKANGGGGAMNSWFILFLFIALGLKRLK